MGAFFSGTDDNDDKKGVFYSGVVGNLDRLQPEFKWRFNVSEIKFNDVKVTDIFDVPQVEIKVPAEWLERVKTQTWEPYSPGKSHTPVGGWAERNTRSGSNNNAAGVSHQTNYGYRQHWDYGCPDLYDDAYPIPGRSFESGDEGYGPVSSLSSPSDSNKEEKKNILVIAPRPGSMSPAEVKRLANRNIIVEEGDGLALLDKSREYSKNTAEFGKEAAEAFEQVCLYLKDMEEKDELLLSVMAIAYQMLSHKGQEKLDKEGIK